MKNILFRQNIKHEKHISLYTPKQIEHYVNINFNRFGKKIYTEITPFDDSRCLWWSREIENNFLNKNFIKNNIKSVKNHKFIIGKGLKEFNIYFYDFEDFKNFYIESVLIYWTSQFSCHNEFGTLVNGVLDFFKERFNYNLELNEINNILAKNHNYKNIFRNR